jgi:hypothetical protein
MSQRQRLALYSALGVFIARMIYPSGVGLVDRLPESIFRAGGVAIVLFVVATLIDKIKNKK